MSQEQKLREALQALLNRYVQLVESGDAGNWDAEKEPEVIAARSALSLPTQAEPVAGGKVPCFPINGKVWFRESTNEWVLELSGVINDTNFTVRHTCPPDTKPEDVVDLPNLYPPASQEQAQQPFHIGAYIVNGTLYASVLSGGNGGAVTVVATAEIPESFLKQDGAMATMREARQHQEQAEPTFVPNTFKLPGESDDAWLDRITGATPAEQTQQSQASEPRCCLSCLTPSRCNEYMEGGWTCPDVLNDQEQQPAAQEVGLTDEGRQQVFIAAERRMVREPNLSWRDAIVDEVIAALRAKEQS